MIPVTKTYFPDFDDYIKKIETIWQKGWLTNNGSLTNELLVELKEYLGLSHLELTANGTLALQLAIKALDIKGEIITTPYSYVATTTSILWEGCTPVFVDIENKTFTINTDLIEQAITENTRAILATHIYGYPCDVIKIEKIAKKYNLKIIYDAAHCFGVKLNGQSILLQGDCSIISFHATKLFHTAEGGAVICKNTETAQRIALMKKFGHHGEDEYLDIGINAKMSELHAAMGLCVLPKANDIISARKEYSGWYDEQLENCEIQRPTSVVELDYNYAYYPVVFSSHEVMMKVRQSLIDNGVGPRRYFYPSLNTLPFLKPELKKSCPISEGTASRVLCLPLYVGLVRDDVETICKIIKRSMLDGVRR